MRVGTFFIAILVCIQYIPELPSRSLSAAGGERIKTARRSDKHDISWSSSSDPCDQASVDLEGGKYEATV